MRFLRLLSLFAIVLFLIASDIAFAQTTVTIGTGTSSSSTRGPFQRADTLSSTVFSRFVQTYTASELAAAGISSGVSITALNWELASSNIMIGSGDATLKIYVKNSASTAAISDTWVNLIAGSSLVVDNSYNTTNNFPGANGWMPFTFSTPFIYTGGALEIAVDWDCSQVSTPAFSGDGAIKWRWQSTAPDFLVAKRTASSAPSSTISDLSSERANIQIVYAAAAAACDAPGSLNAMNITETSADLSWSDSTATSYNWLVVLSGAGVSGTAVDAGNTTNSMVTSTALAAMTDYDFYVASDCGTDTSDYAGPFSFTTLAPTTVQSPITIGTGTSSSSTRGPFQRADTNSTTVFSRFVHTYTASELAAAGLPTGVAITALNWELASSNIMIGSGDATLKVYVKNSAATAAISDTWVNLIAGSDLVVDNIYNTTNNFPGANGWMPFTFTTPFIYTGGALEIAVDWDCSQVSTPAFSGDGSIKWRWQSTAPDFLVAKRTASSAPSSTISDLSSERANIQFVFAPAVADCGEPTALSASNITDTSADLSWSDSTASSYNWRIVLAGAAVNSTAVDSGTTTTTTATTILLAASTSYDLYVEAVCDTSSTSGYAGPYAFSTICSAASTTTVTSTVINVSCNGGSDGAIDLTVVAGVPAYRFSWSTADTTEDVAGLVAGVYGFTITDGNGCLYRDSVLVDEPSALALAITSVNDTANAGVGSASVTVSGGTAPYAYSWNGTAGAADITGLMMGTYVVTVTDANGCIDSASVVLDNVVSISDLDYVTNLAISPNPTNGIARIDLQLSQNAEVGISIYSIVGVLVESFVETNTNQVNRQIDLSSYADGIYVVRFTIDNQSTTKKVILLK
ncbi:MAG: T9SS type A sorting domain-containing protein [Bacteroidia bacterium]|nr:T9SS type A sorting domain-containing protein [Bacteroidia bacterium]